MKNKFLTFLAFIAILSCTTGSKKIFYVDYIENENTMSLPYVNNFYLPKGENINLLTKAEIIQAYSTESLVNSTVFPYENFYVYIIKKQYRNEQKQDIIEIILRTVNDENKILDSFKLAESGGTEYCDGFLTESLSIERECNGFVDKYYIDKESGKFIQQ
ncbi:hypothetical protein [Nonlabens tegetincola]|uniref:hypothetical protein n=1 Tax=Nonlabens tegetincola TaxID=323273 RepID=UPI0005A5D182|nr:hypothetical protein [Nonlabens tegetincola]